MSSLNTNIIAVSSHTNGLRGNLIDNGKEMIMLSQLSTHMASNDHAPHLTFSDCICFAMMILMMSISHAQQGLTPRNSVFLEAGGNGVIYSLNYDRFLTDSFGGRIGLMYASAPRVSGYTSMTIVPVIAEYFVGSGSNKLELGAGAGFFSSRRYKTDFAQGGPYEYLSNHSSTLWTLVAGYRSEPIDGGFLFRAVITPSFGWARALESTCDFLPWGGISVGYAF